MQLTADVNWNGIDLTKVASGSSIDLCGNDLEMTALNGSVINAWSVTDSSAQGSGGKFILTVAEGEEFVNGIISDNGGIVFSGSLRFVKEGTGAYRVHNPFQLPYCQNRRGAATEVDGAQRVVAASPGQLKAQSRHIFLDIPAASHGIEGAVGAFVMAIWDVDV